MSQFGFLGADGAGIHNWDGKVIFEGPAYFSGNEATSEPTVELLGATYGGLGGGIYSGQCYVALGPGIIFRDEVTFVGNKAEVR